MKATNDCFTLKVPCGDCPFRNDGNAIALRPGRREEIIRTLLLSQSPSFPCHKTVYNNNAHYDSEGELIIPNTAKVCAGAAALMKKIGFDMPIIQIAQRLRIIADNHYQDAELLTIDVDELNIN